MKKAETMYDGLMVNDKISFTTNVSHNNQPNTTTCTLAQKAAIQLALFGKYKNRN